MSVYYVNLTAGAPSGSNTPDSPLNITQYNALTVPTGNADFFLTGIANNTFSLKRPPSNTGYANFTGGWTFGTTVNPPPVIFSPATILSIMGYPNAHTFKNIIFASTGLGQCLEIGGGSDRNFYNCVFQLSSNSVARGIIYGQDMIAPYKVRFYGCSFIYNGSGVCNSFFMGSGRIYGWEIDSCYFEGGSGGGKVDYFVYTRAGATTATYGYCAFYNNTLRAFTAGLGIQEVPTGSCQFNWTSPSQLKNLKTGTNMMTYAYDDLTPTAPLMSGNPAIGSLLTPDLWGKPRTGAFSVGGSEPATVSLTPNAPIYVSPLNNTLDIPQAGTNLTWQANNPPAAETYNVYFGKDALPAYPNVTGQAGLSYTTGALTFDSTYKWKIAAVNASGSTDGSTFSFVSIKNRAPSIPTTPSPTDKGTLVHINGTSLSWAPSVDPEGETVKYQVWFGASGGDMTQLDSTHTTTSYALSTLTAGAGYRWQIKAYDIYDNTTASQIWDFTTCPKPNPVSYVEPIDGTGGILVGGTVLKWEANNALVDEDYEIYFGKDTTSTNPKGFITDPPNSWNTPALDYDSTYQWKVRAINESGYTDNTAWSFATQSNLPPTTPTDPRPYDGQVKILIKNQSLSWSASTDPEGGVVSYDVYFGEPGSMNKVMDHTGSIDGTAYSFTDTSLPLPTLQNYTKYNWQVVANDEAGKQQASPIWCFQTIEKPPMPIAASPTNGAIWEVVAQVKLMWACVDPNGPVTFDVFFGINPGDLDPVIVGTTYTFFDLQKAYKEVYTGTVLEGFWTKHPLKPSTDYYWQVIAHGVGGDSISPVFRFRTRGTTSVKW